MENRRLFLVPESEAAMACPANQERTKSRFARPAVSARFQAVLAALVLTLAGCAPLQPPKPESLSTFALDVRFDDSPYPAQGSLTLAVSPPRAGPGFDSAQMIYVKRPYELQSFARNQWIDTPARMLAPLLVQALERSARFRAVAQGPSAIAGDLRLDTEIIRLQQEFMSRPSRIRLTVRAELLDLKGGELLATREFDVSEDAPSDDPYGGVIAANRAVQRVLAEITEFCASQSSRGRSKNNR